MNLNTPLSSTISSGKQQTRTLHFDYLRLLACLTVVYLHVVARPIYMSGIVSNNQWFVYNALSSLSRWCVPAFVMLSGALLLSKPQSWRGVFLKRIPRFLIVLVAASLLFMFYRSFALHEHIFPKIWRELVFKGAYYHLYYLYIVIVLYAITPMVAYCVNALPEPELRAACISLCLFTVLLFSCSSFDGTYTSSLGTRGLEYLGYFILGYYLSKYPLPFKLALWITILGYLITVFGTQYIAVTYGPTYKWKLYFYTYFSPNVMMMAAGIFSMVLYVRMPHPDSWLNRVLPILSGLTLLIYLIHPIMLELIRRAYKHVAPVMLNVSLDLPVTYILTLGLSLLIAFYLRKIPTISRLF